MELSSKVVESLEQVVDAACTNAETDIPGAVVMVVNRDGKKLFAHAAGKRGLKESSGKMELNQVFWIASCTKLVTAIACMQLVEQGKLSLHDADALEQLIPEFKSVKVMSANGKTLVEKKQKITLLMLLTHTSGFGYTFFSERLRDYSHPRGFDEFSGFSADIMEQPLLFQPGENWTYGVGIDWAGIAVERASGMKLNDYMTTYIFKPLGLHSISMLPNSDMASRLAFMHFRRSDGRLMPRDHLNHHALMLDESESKDLFHSGGAGLFSQPEDYCRILSTLLNNGTCPKTGVQILSRGTVDEMFKNHIPDFPDYGRNAIQDAKPDLTHALPGLPSADENKPQGWGLSFMLSNSEATGRSSGTAQWAGLSNLWWWCDRETGIAGFVCSQILPFADPKVLNLWIQVESQIYSALKQK